MSDVVVRVENVSKKFCRSMKQGMLYTASDIAADVVGIRHPQTLRSGEFWAVDDVSFELKRGECIGLIGANGAGKSTLLKILNGIIRPDKGRISLKGRVGALIEVGAGFHPMLSGRENIYVNGAILGMSKREIDRKFDQIVEFSGLHPEVLSTPVKNYSSGMYVRLGFSVAVHCEPEILLIDEVLAVGDGPFVSRCFRKIHELQQNGCTMILTSHNMVAVQEHCTQAIWFAQGQKQRMGNTAEVVTAYRVAMTAEEAKDAKSTKVDLLGSKDGGAAITHLVVRNSDNQEVESVSCGETAKLQIHFETFQTVHTPVFVVGLKPVNHTFVSAFSSDWDGLTFPTCEPGENYIELSLPASLPVGAYQVYCQLADGSEFNHVTYEWNVGTFQVTPFTGMRDDLYLPHNWSMHRNENSLLKEAVGSTSHD